MVDECPRVHLVRLFPPSGEAEWGRDTCLDHLPTLSGSQPPAAFRVSTLCWLDALLAGTLGAKPISHPNHSLTLARGDIVPILKTRLLRLHTATEG
jgi:hypothetical protein